MEHTEMIIGVAIVAAAYQLWVSVELLRSSIYVPIQKTLQLILVWLVPVVGAFIVQSMMRSEGKAPYKPEKGYTEPGDHAS